MVIRRRINMKNTTMDLNLNRREAAGTSACRNNLTAVSGRVIRTNRLALNASCADPMAAADFSRVPDWQAPAVRNDFPTVCKATPCPSLLWRDVLLKGGESGSLLERLLYFVLAATTAASLLMAFWQLRSLEAGWASFVELVGRIVS